MSNIEILEHLKEYLQQKIDSGYHKIFYNDLMWDEKTIDCINAINDLIEENQQLKKQKDDVVEYIKEHTENIDRGRYYEDYVETYELLRMLGEIDE